MTSLLLCAGALLVPDAAPLHRITERKTWKKNTSACRVAVGPVERAGESDPQCDAGGRDYRLGDPHRAPTCPSHRDTLSHQHVPGVRDWGSARRERYAARVGGGG